jgi:hypothetical protein
VISGRPFVPADVLDTLHDALDSLASRIASFGVLDWLLVIAAAALLIWGWVRARAFATLGSLTMDDIKCDGSDFTPAAAKALLQQELSTRGLLPPSGVPGGAPTVASIADAISNAPIDQAKWVGALIKIIPLPPASTGFTIGGTLLKTTDNGRDQVSFAYQLVCTGPHQAVVLDMAIGGDEARAIKNAAKEIYRKVAKAAPAMYPRWAQWQNAAALDAYRAGLELEPRGAQPEGVAPQPDSTEFQTQRPVHKAYAAAHGRYLASSAHDPDNMLVRLRAANCLERMAADARPPRRFRRQTEALAAYVSIWVRQPDIFEAGFRASVIMSTLASRDEDELAANALLLATLGRFERARERFHDRAPVAPTEKPVRERLELAARDQTRATLRRLRPWWTMVHEYRFRHLFEPRGRDRRQLRKVLGISRLAQRARREQQYAALSRVRLRSEVAQVLWRVAVTARMLWRARASGWQANYNAACFYALLPQAARTAESSSGYALRRRALKYLRRAIAIADGELPCAYVREEDADLATLRRLSPQGFALAIGPLCADEVTIHYRRAKSHGKWVLHVWGKATLPHAGRPWDRPLRPVRYGREEVEFRVRIFDENGHLHFLAHKGERKDDQGWDVIPARLVNSEAWVNAGMPGVYGTLKEAREAASQLTVTTAAGAAAGEDGERAVVQALSVNSTAAT